MVCVLFFVFSLIFIRLMIFILDKYESYLIRKWCKELKEILSAGAEETENEPKYL